MKKEKHLEINENNYKGYVELYKTKLITPDREKKEKLKSTLIGLGFMFVIPFISISFFKSINFNCSAELGLSLLLSMFAADIGYRFVVDVTPRWYHEVLLGLRFTFPKL